MFSGLKEIFKTKEQIKIKEQLKKNERKNETTQQFIERKKKEKLENEQKERKKEKNKLLYNSEQILKKYKSNLISLKNIPQNEINRKYKKLDESLKKEIEKKMNEYNSNLRKKIVNKQEYLLKNTQNEKKNKDNRVAQRAYQINKMKQNKKYILTKLESENYNLLYKLINVLFDKKISENSRDKTKEKFQDYLLENPDKNEDIMKILKSVYRLKYNKSIENRKEQINEKLKSLYRLKYNKSIENRKEEIGERLKSGITKEERNNFFSEIKDISSHIDLATGFYDFTGIEYYICNKKQIEENNKQIEGKNKNIKDIEISEIVKLSPIFYANGIFCFNPQIKEYTSNKKDMEEGLSQLTTHNNSSNGIDFVKNNMQNNKKNNLNIVNIDECIKNIEEFNKKDSFLSQFFEKKILGKATQYGIKPEDKINTKYINTINFNRLCSQFNNAIDTIVIVKDNKIDDIYTTTTKNIDIQKEQESGILLEYLKNNMKGGGYKQVGGEPFTIIIMWVFFAIFIVSFFTSLYNCNDKKKKGLINKNIYFKCVSWKTFQYTITVSIGLCFSIFIAALIAMAGSKGGGGGGCGISFSGFLYRIDGDISKNRYNRINEIINHKYNPSETNIELYNLKKSSRELYNKDRLRRLYNRLNKLKSNNSRQELKNMIYENIYENAKNKKSKASSIKSSLLK